MASYEAEQAKLHRLLEECFSDEEDNEVFGTNATSDYDPRSKKSKKLQERKM